MRYAAGRIADFGIGELGNWEIEDWEKDMFVIRTKINTINIFFIRFGFAVKVS